MRILLVDLNSLLYPIYAVSGKEPDPDYPAKTSVARIHALAAGYDGAAVCCDSKRSVRKEVDPTYKANRPERDERLIHQIRLAQETLRADGMPVWGFDGYEADDVIASAVTALRDGTTEIVIGSSDKDLLQLVDDRVSVYSFASGKMFGPAETAEKFVRPELMRDYLILVGDASDNIKGIPGIGHVRAKALLEACGSLANVYERISQGAIVGPPFTPSIVTALKDNLIVAETARRLVTLVGDLPVSIGELGQKNVEAPDPLPAPVHPQEAGSLDHDKPAPISDGASMHDTQTGEIIEATAEPAELRAPAANLVKVEWTRELEPRSLPQAERLARHMYTSRMFAAYGTEQAVLSTILAGRELGVGAMASLRGFHIIEGKPSMSAGLMHALILRSGLARYFRCVKSTAECATFQTLRIGGGDDVPTQVSFTMEEAVLAGLIKDKSGWKKYPADMLVARAIARLARLVYPDICFGLYTPEELGREDLELEAA